MSILIGGILIPKEIVVNYYSPENNLFCQNFCIPTFFITFSHPLGRTVDGGDVTNLRVPKITLNTGVIRKCEHHEQDEGGSKRDLYAHPQ